MTVNVFLYLAGIREPEVIATNHHVVGDSLFSERVALYLERPAKDG